LRHRYRHRPPACGQVPISGGQSLTCYRPAHPAPVRLGHLDPRALVPQPIHAGSAFRWDRPTFCRRGCESLRDGPRPRPAWAAPPCREANRVFALQLRLSRTSVPARLRVPLVQRPAPRRLRSPRSGEGCCSCFAMLTECSVCSWLYSSRLR
jgi:hypothetical protein